MRNELFLLYVCVMYGVKISRMWSGARILEIIYFFQMIVEHEHFSTKDMELVDLVQIFSVEHLALGSNIN